MAWQWPADSPPGFIQDWLVLAPLTLEEDQRGVKGLEREQLRGEATLKPRAGEPVPVDGGEFTWRAYDSPEPFLEFYRFLEKVCHHSAAYAVCYVMSERERHDLLLQVSICDPSKVYLNGQQVYKQSRGNYMVPIGPVTLA